jgi:hypothetical protein
MATVSEYRNSHEYHTSKEDSIVKYHHLLEIELFSNHISPRNWHPLGHILLVCDHQTTGIAAGIEGSEAPAETPGRGGKFAAEGQSIT